MVEPAATRCTLMPLSGKLNENVPNVNVWLVVPARTAVVAVGALASTVSVNCCVAGVSPFDAVIVSG